MKTTNEKIAVVLMTIGTILFIVLLLTLPTFWLWNWLMPIIFKLPEITIWQALGLTLLCKILFTTSNSK